MDVEQRDVLARVADGSITPDEALRLLDGERERPSPTRRSETSGRTSTQRETGDVRLLRVSSELGIVTVLGDRQVKEAVADGPCSIRRQGDTIIITADQDDGLGSYRVGSGRGRRASVVGRRRVTVRANPDLALELEIAAGKAEVVDMHGHIKADVELGKLLVSGFRGPVDISVAAGKVEMSGRLDHGDSRIRCEIGKVDVHLEKSSDVRITGHAELGSVRLPKSGARQSDGSVTLGTGAATLDVQSAAGSVEVRA